MLDWSGSYSVEEVDNLLATTVATASQVLSNGGFAVGIYTYDYHIYQQLGYPFTTNPADVAPILQNQRSFTGAATSTSFWTI